MADLKGVTDGILEDFAVAHRELVTNDDTLLVHIEEANRLKENVAGLL